MATAEATLITGVETEKKIVEFIPEALVAPFPLRLAALIIDYMVLLLLPVVWLVLARFVSDTGVPDGIGKTIWTLSILTFICDCLVLPIFGGQSVGKMVVGIRIVQKDGRRAHTFAILLRNVLGYLLTVATFGLGFLLSSVSPLGRALHDYIGGTMVIRGRRRPT